MYQTKIIGTGHYLPEDIVNNSDFLNHSFFEEDGTPITDKSNAEIIDKFKAITEIEQRRYLKNADLFNSDMATEAAKKAIADAKIDPETLDYIIVAHNFGDAHPGAQVDVIPSLSARVKGKLGIKNQSCRPYDMIFGCPGWVEGMIMADQFIVSGLAKAVLVIGSETLSRVIDPFDRNGMIFADGAGATVVVSTPKSDQKSGVLAYKSQCDNDLESQSFLTSDSTLNKDVVDHTKTYIRMRGRKIYEYAVKNVPALMKDTMDMAGIHLNQVKHVLIHQANAKMDHAMVSRLCKLYDVNELNHSVVPMTIQEYGNSSVATIPTLLDKLHKGDFGDKVQSGDIIVMASVGAGMNCNAMVYQYP